METVNQGINAANDGSQTESANTTFTQEDVDRIVGERLARERAKYADYETIREKAAKFDQAEEASKSELQKATERAEKLQAQLDSYQKAETVRRIHDEVAAETGVPAHLLTGETKEDCEAQAKAIMSFAKPSGYPNVKDAGETLRGNSGATRDQFNDWFNEQLSK